MQYLIESRFRLKPTVLIESLVQREAEVCISEKRVKFIGDIYRRIYIFPETQPSATSSYLQNMISTLGLQNLYWDISRRCHTKEASWILKVEISISFRDWVGFVFIEIPFGQASFFHLSCNRIFTTWTTTQKLPLGQGFLSIFQHLNIFTICFCSLFVLLF
jgi:hypothetical protein